MDYYEDYLYDNYHYSNLHDKAGKGWQVLETGKCLQILTGVGMC